MRLHRRFVLVFVVVLFGWMSVVDSTSAVPIGQDSGESQSSETQEPEFTQEEFEALQERVRELENELEAAHRRIEQLEAQLNSQETLIPEVIDPDPLVLSDDQPLASIDALFAVACDHYVQEMSEYSLDGDARERRTAIGHLRQWILRDEKKYRQRIEWTCETVRHEELSTGENHLILIVRDAETGARWSEPFDLIVPARLNNRLKAVNLNKPIVVKGIFSLDLILNEDRYEKGTFDEPRFVGRYVEFDYKMVVRSISQAEGLTW